MDIGHFYYLNDQYFVDFPDSNLMQNKETVNGQVHDRLCFYTFQDTNTGLYWMIPFSSKVDKFVGIYIRRFKNMENAILLFLEKSLDIKRLF